MAENTKRPAIRFAGFTEEWEQRKLGEVCSLITKGTTPLDKNITGTINFIKIESIDETSGEIRITQKITDREHNGYLRRSQLKENDILFSIAGTLGRVTSVKTDVLPANTNQALAIIRLKSGCLQYVETYLKGKAVADFIKKNPTIGAQPNLSLEQVGNLEISFPAEREQEKLGTYFRNLDHLIALHQHKYEKLTHVKKSMLEKMFPKHGSHVPEIRFKGFTDAWERRKLGEMADSFEYGLNAAAIEYDGNSKYIRITDIDDVSRDFIQDEVTSPDTDLSKADNYILSKGDILFARTGASVGKTYIYKPHDGLVYYAGFLIRARIKKEYDPEFVFQNTLTNRFEKFITVTSMRSGQPGINAQEYAQFELMMPSKSEQRKIGTYFRNLDHLITLQQRKLIKLQNIKKAMLEKMFPLHVRRDGNDF